MTGARRVYNSHNGSARRNGQPAGVGQARTFTVLERWAFLTKYKWKEEDYHRRIECLAKQFRLIGLKVAFQRGPRYLGNGLLDVRIKSIERRMKCQWAIG